ncbi:MAG TPA: carbohydrate kinase [Cyclobacteriaceae bacterium]|nr:carbohydrate kinase [Cyclobacteriaceae bacterium]
MSHPKIVCFGEMLWDVFPQQKIAGGAPMNLALHLQHLKAQVAFVSKIGDDQEGEELLTLLHEHALPTDKVLIDPTLPTGRVIVDDADKENIKYEIVKPSAWDNITWNENLQHEVSKADAFIFGSLAAREPNSRTTLLKLLDTPVLKVFDINLRAPFYSFELLKQLLAFADILKLNEEELAKLMEFHMLEGDYINALDHIAKEYRLQMICVTKGKHGADLYKNGALTTHVGYQVKVEDTVGSGDAFLSAFIYSYLEGNCPDKILDDACALGALVATKKGGTPKYTAAEIERIKRDGKRAC